MSHHNGQVAIAEVFRRLRKEGYYCKQRETDYNFRCWCNGREYSYIKTTSPKCTSWMYRTYEKITPEKYLFYKNTSLLTLQRAIGITGLAWKGDIEEIKGILESEGFQVRLPDMTKNDAYKIPIFIQYKPIK